MVFSVHQRSKRARRSALSASFCAKPPYNHRAPTTFGNAIGMKFETSTDYDDKRPLPRCHRHLLPNFREELGACWLIVRGHLRELAANQRRMPNTPAFRANAQGAAPIFASRCNIKGRQKASGRYGNRVCERSRHRIHEVLTICFAGLG
ncbi:hypothetical protein M3J09_004715 [Ascochyta lentis]